MSQKRTLARQRALQALYQWQMTAEDDLAVTAHGFLELQTSADPIDGQGMQKVDITYFNQLLEGAIAIHKLIDEMIAPWLDRPLQQLDPIERAILWLSGYEMSERLEIPYRVIINEGVELAKGYGADQSHRYINSILDRMAQRLRGVEVGQGRQRSSQRQEG
jgi:transcription antitermination protein NusB